jgi:hypothetical protein
LEIIQIHQEKLKSLITSTRPLEETQIALKSALKENKVILAFMPTKSYFRKEGAKKPPLIGRDILETIPKT